MKLVISKLIGVTLTLGQACSVLPAGAGEMTSGGGDVQAMQFTALGYEVAGYLETLKSRHGIELTDVRPSEFLSAVQTTRIVSEDELMLDGYPVDSINVPALKLIRVSRKRWKESENDSEFRLGFVLHEYLGILQKNDERYDRSHEFLEMLSRYGFASAQNIECVSFTKRAFSPDLKDDGRLKLHISNRGVFNGLIHFELHEQRVDSLVLMDRFTREAPPSIYEMYGFEDQANRFHFELKIKIPNGRESFDSTAVISDIGLNGERSFLTFSLRCNVL